jgi:hypothetical protein
VHRERERGEIRNMEKKISNEALIRRERERRRGD